MADTSLNQYLTRIDTLLGEGLYDQAAFHSRAILQQLPKNIAAYRLLGQALLLDKRWDDAGEVLRRILSVAPDDAFAHRGLSEVYRHTDQPLDAIWHLERVQEQDTNNPEIIKSLRQLYRDYRGTDQPRLQLTVGAVARQYARNGLYEQAAAALRRALQQKPERVDLRLLLARVLRESGNQIEAARVALDVLETLPDCLEANTMLIELWLDQQRPSDAQRYLSRLEAVDPYLALELARGAPPDDDVIQVQEADYQADARRRLASSTPDWLSQIDHQPDAPPAEPDEDERPADVAPLDSLPDDADLLETASGDTIVAEPEPASDWLGAPPSDSQELDWLDDVAGASATANEQTTASDPFREQQPVPPPTTRKRGLTGLLASLSDDDTDDTPEAAQDEPQPPLNTADLFADFPDDDAPAEPLQAESADDAVSQRATTDDDGEEDPLAWMRDSGIEMVENADSIQRRGTVEFDDPAGELSDPEDEDPLAWLHQSGVEILDDDQPAEADIIAADDDDDDIATDDEDEDPLAWLHQSGVEILDDDQPAEAAYSPAQSDDDEADPLDWLADDSLLDELLDIESLVSEDSPDIDTFDSGAHAVTADTIPTEEDAPEIEPTTFHPTGQEEDRQDIMPDKNDTEFPDWLTEPDDDDEQSDAGTDSASEPDEFSLDWLNSEHDEETQQASPGMPTEPFDWPQFSVASDDDDDEETDDDQPETSGFGEPGLFGDTEDGFQWGDSDEPFASPTEDTPDWLRSVSDSAGDDDSEEEEAEPTEAVPDWLADMQPAAISEADDDDEDELTFDEDEDEAAEEAVPDWLADMQPAAISEADDDDEDELAFDEDLMFDEDEDEEPVFDDDRADDVAEEEIPVWLADMQPKEGTDAPWFAETQETESFDEEEPAAAAEEDAEHDLQDFSFATEESSDWPAGDQMAAAAFASQADDSDDEPIDWSGEAYPTGEVAEDSAQPGTDDVPEQEEWFADAADAGLLEADEAFTPHEQGPVMDEPTEDWMLASAQMAEDAGSDADDEFAEVEAQFDDEFDAFQQDEDEPFAASAEPLEFEAMGTFDDGEEETTPTPASNAPDWLNAMVPGLDVDYEAEEDAQVEEAFDELPAQSETAATAPAARTSGEFGWLTEIVDEEFNAPPENLPATPPPAAAAPGKPRFSFSRPPAWLRKLRGEAPEATASTAADDEPIGEDLPDWLEFDDDDDFEADAGRR